LALIELGFDLFLSRFEPARSFFKPAAASEIDNRHAALCRSNQISCAVGSCAEPQLTPIQREG
jgi:hypothetical protein